MMDAKNGEIVNFSRPQNAGKKSVTDQKAKAIAKNALASLAPKHVNDYILNDNASNGVFSFIRNVNGVDFDTDQINICVDMTNENIVWYNYSYNNIKFPSLKNVISPDKISKVFFENSNPPYHLQADYMLPHIPSKAYQPLFQLFPSIHEASLWIYLLNCTVY